MDASVCAAVIDRALWDWPCTPPCFHYHAAYCVTCDHLLCDMRPSLSPPAPTGILSDTTIDRACAAARAAVEAMKAKGVRDSDEGMVFEDVSGLGLVFRQVCTRVCVCVCVFVCVRVCMCACV